VCISCVDNSTNLDITDSMARYFLRPNANCLSLRQKSRKSQIFNKWLCKIFFFFRTTEKGALNKNKTIFVPLNKLELSHYPPIFTELTRNYMKTSNIKCHCKRKINTKSMLITTLLAEVLNNCYRADLHANNPESKLFCGFSEIRQRFLCWH
jgi:hypothetical protein